MKIRQYLFLLVIIIMGIALCGCQDKEALENQKAYRQVGINKMNEGSYAEAAEAFQKALDQSVAVVSDMEIDICYYKAAAQYKSGDANGAITTYNALIDYNEKDAKAYFLRGCVYLKEGNGEQAMADYRKSFEITKGNYEMYVLAYENLINAGFTAEAQEVLNASLRLKGEEPADYRERGHIYLLLGDYENARKELDQAINGGDEKAILYMAQSYDASGDSEQAKAMYESYISKNESDGTILTALGEMQMEEGNYSQALDFFDKALALENIENEQQILRNEIIAYEKLLDFAKAKEKMAEYLEKYPDDEDAKRESVFLETR